MAAILTTLFFLALGFAIGWWIKRRFFAPVSAESQLWDIFKHLESDESRNARLWAQHLAEHAEAQKGSVVITAPPILDPRAVSKAMRQFERRFGP